MKQHKRYEISWHSRTVIIYVAGVYSHKVKFTEALKYQRDIITKLLASLDRNGFQLTGHTADKAWVYEGFSL